MLQRVIVVMLAIAVCGCTSTFYETHYFRSRPGSSTAIPNYYRLTVEGSSFISSSRYLSGYFDEDTINAYFNEFSQPARGAIVTARTPSASTPTVEPAAAKLQGQKLIMILSSNSDAVATQIGALASSKQFTASLAGLLARDTFAGADNAEARLVTEKARAKITANLAHDLTTGLPDDAAQPVATQALLTFVNVLAADFGHEVPFRDLEAAAQWLELNRARLLRTDR